MGPEAQFFDNKKASEKLLTSCPIDQEKFKFGHTKVFFRAGFLGTLEELRDSTLGAIFIGVQAAIRVKTEKAVFVYRLQKRESARTIQSNIRAFMYLKDWEWMKIMYKIKPLLATFEAAKEMEEVLEEFENVKAQLEKETKRRKELEESQIALKKRTTLLFNAQLMLTLLPILKTDVINSSETRSNSRAKSRN